MDSYFWTNKTVPYLNETTNSTMYSVGNYSFMLYPDNSTWDYVDYPYNVTINARASIFGTVDVGEGVRFNLNQGGALSQSRIIPQETLQC